MSVYKRGKGTFRFSVCVGGQEADFKCHSILLGFHVDSKGRFI